ncbi:MAG: hypothetical protein QY327_10785 [Fimbriimonadaceae bacterium]|nr:MAG: hypothetical protein UZ18_ATM001000189 [Armatimonadetes bacterium OLB18]WKZ79815.1 MAG: hypothetical protein QY327_10785 [Fimbriimonadaceae bacterium]
MDDPLEPGTAEPGVFQKHEQACFVLCPASGQRNGCKVFGASDAHRHAADGIGLDHTLDYQVVQSPQHSLDAHGPSLSCVGLNTLREMGMASPTLLVLMDELALVGRADVQPAAVAAHALFGSVNMALDQLADGDVFEVDLYRWTGLAATSTPMFFNLS